MKNAIILRLVREVYVGFFMEYLRDKAKDTKETKVDDYLVSILEKLIGVDE